MADNKKGRDKQAHDEERRQRKRELATELERSDEPEPPIDLSDLADIEAELEAISFPATGATVVEAVGDRTVQSVTETYELAELTPDSEAETFDSPVEVRERIQRPTVATAMKVVVEATETVPDTTLGTSQRDAYEKTFRALAAIDADDDDEGVAFMRDWIVDQIQEKEGLPGSRDVRRRAAKFCRERGFEIRNDEWLGV